MTTIAKCTHCETTFKVKDHLVGKAVRCPRCQQAFRIRMTPVVTSRHKKPATDTSATVAEPEPASPPPDDDFFGSPEDPDTLYDQTVAHAQLRKRKRHWATVIAIGSIASLVLICGTVAALQFAYQEIDLSNELADLESVDVESLRGNWRPVSDPHWGYLIRMPGDPDLQESTSGDTVTLVLPDRELGRMRLEVRKEANDAWNNYFARLEREEILAGVPGANVMEIRSSQVNWSGKVAVYRYFLTPKDRRVSTNVTVVQKFSTEGKTITVQWSGPRQQLGSPEVFYYFNSVEFMGKKYIGR
ncbi:MJ0042-type zinc finger domain-containing protein [Bremerella cremea]|uniref:MJ0042-type zinc finger domain-containing protein n=1 Tax=Bremerella cremea TaxID=1031537 RepID=UPI0031E73522